MLNGLNFYIFTYETTCYMPDTVLGSGTLQCTKLSFNGWCFYFSYSLQHLLAYDNILTCLLFEVPYPLEYSLYGDRGLTCCHCNPSTYYNIRHIVGTSKYLLN